MKNDGERAPDYVQERTGHTRRSFSHSMTLNCNTPTQARLIDSHFLNVLRYSRRSENQTSVAAPLTPD